jgi:DNA-binding transcriptional ArsR family regulator
MAHPVRIQILNILGERVASPNQMAEITGELLGTVAYHVRVLLKLDFIELAKTETRRGATEHFYRVNSDSIEKRGGPRLAHLALQVDEKGWREILAIVVRSEEEIRRAGKEASERLRADPGIPVVITLAAFEAASNPTD